MNIWSVVAMCLQSLDCRIHSAILRGWRLGHGGFGKAIPKRVRRVMFQQAQERAELLRQTQGIKSIHSGNVILVFRLPRISAISESGKSLRESQKNALDQDFGVTFQPAQKYEQVWSEDYLLFVVRSHLTLVFEMLKFSAVMMLSQTQKRVGDSNPQTDLRG